jgi:hypothetical protein
MVCHRFTPVRAHRAEFQILIKSILASAPRSQTMDMDNTPTRVEELWFSDSGLVVQAEQSLFRVSGAVLAARSPIFKDMLSFTQPPDAETIDGCPVVKLPDLAIDITCFFRAIFDSS